MTLESLLLFIMNRFNGERFIYATFHLLRGKKSGQTLQDVTNYSLQSYFMILPTLNKTVYDEAVAVLEKEQLIVIQQDAIVTVTEKGQAVVQTIQQDSFNGWDYRGKEHIFFGRLALIIQTLSQFRVGEYSFLPNERTTEIQDFVRHFFQQYIPAHKATSRQLHNEIQQAFEKSELTSIQKTIIVHRLSGYQMSGWTWEQLAFYLHIDRMEVCLLFIEALHKLLNAILKMESTPMLLAIADKIKTMTYLTESAMKTKDLLDQGFHLAKIAEIRQLKSSTIEDHFIEIVLNDPSTSVEQYITDEQIKSVQQIVRTLKTKRLKVLKEQCPSLSYFQLRIIIGLPM